MTCLITSIWLGLLIAFLLGLLLGWWLWACCNKSKNKELIDQRDDWKNKYHALKLDHGKASKLKASFVAPLPKGVKKDDLTVVEGIGPKISEILNNAGITTWKLLADSSVEQIQTHLDNAGSRFKLARPGSWPKQALMAYEGKWDELQKWQDEHVNGQEFLVVDKKD